MASKNSSRSNFGGTGLPWGSAPSYAAHACCRAGRPAGWGPSGTSGTGAPTGLGGQRRLVGGELRVTARGAGPPGAAGGLSGAG
jgi:hypothetical protein